MIRLCAFADEADSCLQGQIAALREHRIPLIEVRSIDGNNVAAFTDEQAYSYAAELQKNGVGVFSIGSPLGKVPLAKAAAHMKTVQRVCELAHIFDTRRIRIFSFYEAQGKGNTVISALREMVAIARGYGLTLCHENEKGIYGDSDVRVLELLDAVEGLHAVFDPANFVQCGVSVPVALERLFERTDYFHIKDVIASTGELVPAGYGDGAISAILTKIATSGKKTVLTLEPHLRSFAGYAQIDKEEMKHRFHFATASESFSAAANTLKNVLDTVGYRESEIQKGWITV